MDAVAKLQQMMDLHPRPWILFPMVDIFLEKTSIKLAISKKQQ